jgi:hypothetical protein
LPQAEGTFVQLNEPVKMSVEFQPQKPRIGRFTLYWRRRQYIITRVNLYHNAMEGEVLMHYFSVTAGGKFFKLRFDSKRLQWFITSIYEP